MFSVLAIIQTDVVYCDRDVEVIYFCLDAFKVLTRELSLEAFGKGKVYPRKIDGWGCLAFKRFADGIIEHGAKVC